MWSCVQIGAGVLLWWNGEEGRGQQQGNYDHISPKCVPCRHVFSTTLLKAKCKSSDALYTARPDQTVKTIDGSGCQRSVFMKHPFSISKHIKIQALRPAWPWSLATNSKIFQSVLRLEERTKQKANSVCVKRVTNTGNTLEDWLKPKPTMKICIIAHFMTI